MKLTKLEHFGCVIEKDGLKVVCDPVEFETILPELNNVVPFNIGESIEL